MTQEAIQGCRTDFDNMLQQDAPKLGQLSHQKDKDEQKMTEEEQKIKWALHGERWQPAGKTSSTTKLYPDNLRERIGGWTTVKHSPPGDVDSDVRKRDKKAQSKFHLGGQQQQKRGRPDDAQEIDEYDE